MVADSHHPGNTLLPVYTTIIKPIGVGIGIAIGIETDERKRMPKAKRANTRFAPTDDKYVTTKKSG
jgi:hypothetical protein